MTRLSSSIAWQTGVYGPDCAACRSINAPLDQNFSQWYAVRFSMASADHPPKVGGSGSGLFGSDHVQLAAHSPFVLWGTNKKWCATLVLLQLPFTPLHCTVCSSNAIFLLKVIVLPLCDLLVIVVACAVGRFQLRHPWNELSGYANASCTPKLGGGGS